MIARRISAFSSSTTTPCAGVNPRARACFRRAGKRGVRGESLAADRRARAPSSWPPLCQPERFTSVAQLMIMKHADPLVGRPLQADHLTPFPLERDRVSVKVSPAILRPGYVPAGARASSERGVKQRTITKQVYTDNVLTL